MRDGQRVRIVTANGAYSTPVAGIARVESRNCGTGSSDTRTSFTTVDGRTQQNVTVICTDRIRADAARSADLVKRMQLLPLVQSRTCGIDGVDGRTSFTTKDSKTGQSITVICTDRIRRDAEEAAAASRGSARRSMAIALAGVASARASLANDRNLSGQARDEALAGMDKAMAEMKANIANADRN